MVLQRNRQEVLSSAIYYFTNIDNNEQKTCLGYYFLQAFSKNGSNDWRSWFILAEKNLEKSIEVVFCDEFLEDQFNYP